MIAGIHHGMADGTVGVGAAAGAGTIIPDGGIPVHHGVGAVGITTTTGIPAGAVATTIGQEI